MKSLLKRVRFLVLCVFACGVSARTAWALEPSLAVQTSTGLAGGTAVMIIQLSTGTTGVAGFLLDITLPSALSPVSVTAGSAASAAGKAAGGHLVSSGVYRVAVIGLGNSTAINSGPVAVVTVQIANGTPPGNLFLNVGNLEFTDPGGNALAGTGTGGLVTVLTGGAISIFGVAATGVTTTDATIVWTTDAAGSSLVNYGLTSAYGSSTVLDNTSVTSHSQDLGGGLIAATIYHYQVLSNGVPSGDFIFSTDSGAGPMISAVTPTVLGASSATVTWTTDIPADSQVTYGTTTAYGLGTALDPTLTLSHAQTLVGLSSTTLYHFDVLSHDAVGHLSASPDSTFTTGSAVVYTSSPVITGVTVSNITPFSADVSWTTDQPSNSSVTYGKTGVFFLIASDPSLVTSHVVHISSLTPSFTYDYWSGSQNTSGLTSISAASTFTTSAATAGDYPLLAIGSGSGGLGGIADINVQVSTGLAPINSIVFNLELPTLVTGASTTTGPAATASNMAASGTQMANGQYQVQISGISSPLSQSGSVATIHLAIDSQAFAGTYPLAASSAQFYDSNLNRITLNSLTGTLVITGGAPVRVWPNPWRSDLHSALPITFGHLTQGSEIRIFTTSGYWVRTLRNSTDTLTWDLKNADGNRVASGLYYYLITSPNYDKVTGALVVIH